MIGQISNEDFRKLPMVKIDNLERKGNAMNVSKNIFENYIRHIDGSWSKTI